MQRERLVRYLNSVGKKCFVKYFELFNDENIPNHEIAGKILDENEYTGKSCNSRTGHARMIIREGGAEEALRIIAESRRLEAGVIKQAIKHLQNITA